MNADGVFAFSIVPIRVAVVFGAAAMFVSTIYVLYVIYAKLFLWESPQGFTVLIVAVTFLSVVVLFFLRVQRIRSPHL